MAISPDLPRPVQTRDTLQNGMYHTRRTKYVIPSNQDLLTAFTTFCCFVFMLTFLETCRVLIPSRVVTKTDLHLLTEGFTNDLTMKNEGVKDEPVLTARPRKPGAVVVGFSHCGAYVIMSALSVHPEVVVNKKNLNFFSG
ncbi:hypothetical protein Btru_055709 [Bulinus truncatus]|nr:hypothetical protein Btru_055709 [Bulinus truncatus]